MFKELYGTSMIKYENKEEILEYYILNSEESSDIRDYESTNFEKSSNEKYSKDNNTQNKMKIYGIEIVKKCANHEEKSFISDLTVNKTFAEEIIKTIKDNVVTPVHLYDVLENFL